MANPSAKARRPSRSSLHTRIFPSVATLKSRAWFLCLVSGNQLTCSKCHKLRITGTVTAAQPLQRLHLPNTGAEPGTSLVPNELLLGAGTATDTGKKCIQWLGLSLNCSFYCSPALSFGIAFMALSLSPSSKQQHFPEWQMRKIHRMSRVTRPQKGKILRKPDCMTCL